MTPEPSPAIDELLAAYADDPTSLSVAERAAVLARCDADPKVAAELAELRAVLADVRAHGDVADAGTDWAALEAGIRVAVTPAPRRMGRWLAGAGLALAAAAGLTLWWQHRRAGDGPGLDVAALVPVLPAAPVAVPAPTDAPRDRAITPDPALDDELAALDDSDDLGGDGDDDDGGDLGSADDEALIGRALEPVPVAVVDDGLFPGLDTEWVDDLSEVEVQQALRWLDQQGAG